MKAASHIHIKSTRVKCLPEYYRLALVLSSARRPPSAPPAPFGPRRPVSTLSRPHLFLRASPSALSGEGMSPWELNDRAQQNLMLTRLGCHRLFGFFFGSTLAGGGVYYYALQEYKASNELLTEDIYVRVCI